jgi:hypothetical protein
MESPALTQLELGALRRLEAYVRQAKERRFTAADIEQIEAILTSLDVVHEHQERLRAK